MHLMRARRPTLVLISALIVISLMLSGCFEAKRSSVTVTDPVVVGEDTTAKTIQVGGGSTAPSTSSIPVPTTTTSADTGGSTGDIANGKKLYLASSCGGCHTLKDAGSNGKVGPDLTAAKLDAAKVEYQILNAKAPMPANLYQGQDAKDVAAYVASVDGS